MIRVTSGSAKGRKLKVPATQEKTVSVQEIAKLAAFSVIGDRIDEAKVADLYCGSGNLGIEALSRGAGFCDFVDLSMNALNTLKENLALTNFTDQAQIIHADALKYLSAVSRNYDVVFADPYYTDKPPKHLIKTVPQALKEDGVFVLFLSKNVILEEEEIPAVLELIKRGVYGQTQMLVYALNIDKKL